jgi:hypothetical protein
MLESQTIAANKEGPRIQGTIAEQAESETLENRRSQSLLDLVSM